MLTSAALRPIKKGCLIGNPLLLVEAAGIEPASASPLPLDLHV